MSLRLRLVCGLLVLALCGFAVADAVIYSQTRTYLIGQLDRELAAAAPSIERSALIGQVCSGRFGLPLQPGMAIELRDTSGSVVLQCQVQNAEGGVNGLPELGAIKLPGSAVAPDLSSASFSTPAGFPYRVYSAAVPANGFGLLGDGGTFVLALPLGPTQAALGNLLLVELLVSGGVLFALVGLALVVVRLGLRPLREIEVTAGAIAAGDLSQRVAREDARTEVGRLGRSLNAMLGQIEGAFAERTAAERRLRQFIADASHELRTPLTSIRGYAELFRRGAAARPEDLERSMRRIEDEAARMGVLVEDLLLLARLDQGRPLERAPVDLAAIAADAVADASAADPDRPITLDAPGAVVVEGDADRLRQVVANLVGNAVVHTPAGTPVHVRAARENDEAVVEVADEGPGIGIEHADRVFERFYRADASRQRDRGGTGLGLSIVASIAAAHGGTATLDNVPGVGARFRVALPLASGAGRPPAVLDAPAASVSALPATSVSTTPDAHADREGSLSRHAPEPRE